MQCFQCSSTAVWEIDQLLLAFGAGLETAGVVVDDSGKEKCRRTQEKTSLELSMLMTSTRTNFMMIMMEQMEDQCSLRSMRSRDSCRSEDFCAFMAALLRLQPSFSPVFMLRGQNQDALKAALSNPPLAADKSSKVREPL